MIENNNNEYLDSCLNFVKENLPLLENEFLKQVKISDFEILNRLLIAIVREGIFKNVIFINELKEESNLIIQFEQECSDGSDDDGVNEIGELSIPIKKVYNSFGTFTISNYPIFKLYGKTTTTTTTTTTTIEISNCFKLLNLFYKFSIFDKNYLPLYIDEIENSIGNQSIINLYSILKNKEIKEESNTLGNNCNTIQSYVFNKIKQDKEFDVNCFYEQLYSKGHTIHPCSKLRKGFNVNDMFKYSSEFFNNVNLEFIGIHISKCGFTSIDSFSNDTPNTFLFYLYPNCKEPIENYLNKESLPFNEYTFHLVHPWQKLNYIKQLFNDEINSKLLILIPGDIVNVLSKPLIAIRTSSLFNKSNNLMPHFKTPLAVKLTCSLRNIYSQEALQVCLFSKLIKEIVKRESTPLFEYGSKICFLNEIFSSWYIQSKLDDEIGSLKHESLTSIWRENPNIFIDDQLNQQVIVGCSLITISPISGKLILCELIEQSMNYNGSNDIIVGAINWFKNYIELLLNTTVVLMTKYGISLEAHLQNTLFIINNNGEIVKVISKDWGGIRIDINRLNNQGLQFNCPLNSTGISKSISDLHNRFLHSVIHINIGEIIQSISNEYSNLSEQDLWKFVACQLKSIFLKLKQTSPNLLDQINLDQQIIFQETIEIKALTKMRLKSEIYNNLNIKIKNPLFKL